MRLLLLGLAICCWPGPVWARVTLAPSITTLAPTAGRSEGTLLITNTEQTPLSCEMRVTGMTADTPNGAGAAAVPTLPALTITPRTFTLAARAEQRVLLSLPPGARTRAGRYTAQVQACCGGNTPGPTGTVVIEAPPTIAVRPAGPADGSQTAPGLYTATARFRVEDNLASTRLSIEATPLFLTEHKHAPAVSIPLDMTNGILIEPQNIEECPGATCQTTFVGPGAHIGAYPSQRSGSLLFESSSAGGFAQDVYVTVCWRCDGTAPPTGEYTGGIRLIALVIPE